MAIAISLFAFVSTLMGGLFALRLRQNLALVLGFSAGAVVGVALFDLMPEAVELVSPSTMLALGCVGAGYGAYHLLHRGAAHLANAGTLGAATMSIHSFLDGLSIGVSFQVSAAVGVAVAIAVIVHDLCDGINVVNIVARSGGGVRARYRWLLIDAAAPVAGAATAYGFTLDDTSLGLALAVFAGFFLYIGASDLLPASVRSDTGYAPALMAVLGMAVLYSAVRLASP
jgi:zinc transporter ZupT